MNHERRSLNQFGPQATPFGERGMALLMVMGVLAACMLLISHIILVSQLVSRESYMVSRKGLLRYQAESAAETAFWMHLTDRRLFSNRTLGETDNDMMREDADFEPWMLDGRPHLFDNGGAVVYLQSGENGIKVSSLESDLRVGLDLADDADRISEIDDFVEAFKDYTDSDDFLSLNGYEADDYAAAGFPTLPRNAPMQFKEEFYWLPNWSMVIQDEICIIPPQGITYNFGQNKKPSVFSASDESIRLRLGLDEGSSELELIREALQEWHENGIPLEETLDFNLLTEIKANFDFTEAGLAIVSAVAYDPNREIHAGYRVTREAKVGSNTFFSDSKKECLSIWHRAWE
ncbi:MAG: general secretion pathway protein GspK [Victivallales bacterium]|nr:general secretion pathway protein GspK [Victivallales bacterium]